MPDTTDDLLRQALKALRAALEDGRKQRRQADELLANMRDRLKSTIEGNR